MSGVGTLAPVTAALVRSSAGRLPGSAVLPQAALVHGVAVATIAGFFAAIVMDVPMRRLTGGMVPAYAAAAALLGRPIDEVAERIASSVRYTAGTVAGALFGLLAALLEGVVPPLVRMPGGALGPYLLAGALTLAALVGVVGYLLLPRFGDAAIRERIDRIRRDWAVSATVYVLALLAFVPAGRWLLG